MTYIVNRYNIEKEENLNNVVLTNLAQRIITHWESREYYNWYKDSCDYRLQLLRNNKHLKITK